MLQFRFEACLPQNVSTVMAGLRERSCDAKRTVVVSNYPPDVGEEELTIHFQQEKYGGGDVDEVMVEGNVAFVTFDLQEGLKCFILFKLLYCLLHVNNQVSAKPGNRHNITIYTEFRFHF